MNSFKRKSISIVCTLLVLCLCGCANNMSRTIDKNITIPENGVIEENILSQLKSNNSVSIFTGESNGIKYEWTVFGSDISEPHKLNMAIDIDKTSEDNSISFEMKSAENFGFSSMLSIYLDERWNAQSATAFSDNDGKLNPVGSVSITGTDSSILNFSMTETHGRYVIKVDKNEEPENTVHTNATTETTTNTTTKITTNAKTTINTSTATGITESNTETTTTISTNTTQTVTEQENTDVPDNTEYYEEPECYQEQKQEVVTESEDSRIYSDGMQTEQDKYLTDPVPEGQPMPVEPEDAEIDDNKIMTCTFSIECTTILNNIKDLEPEKLDVLPSDGIILEAQTVEFKEGESVFDVLQRVCKENNIQMEASFTPVYNSAYVEGINNLYEFDCGSLSGWMYRVNGWYPNYGCSRYQLVDGEVVEWRFTCDLGKDVGCDQLSET